MIDLAFSGGFRGFRSGFDVRQKRLWHKPVILDQLGFVLDVALAFAVIVILLFLDVGSQRYAHINAVALLLVDRMSRYAHDMGAT